MNETVIDMRNQSEEELALAKRLSHLAFTFNNTMPMTEEYDALMRQVFCDNIGTGSIVHAPIAGVSYNNVRIGDNVLVFANCLFMAAGNPAKVIRMIERKQ